MTITLNPELEKAVRDKVERGEYESADALVAEAGRLLVVQESEEDAYGDEIRARIEAAEAEIDRGDYVEYDADKINELARDVHERGQKKLAAGREKPGVRR